jgi:hypothetical protein
MPEEISPVYSDPVPITQKDTTEAIPANEDEAAEEERKVPTFVWIVAAILGAILAGLIGLSFLPEHVLARFRDVAIVFLVLLFFFLMVLLLIMVAALIYAINRLSERLDDVLQRGGQVLDEVKGTARTVKGTAGFVGERVASPFIRVASWSVGVGKGIRTFFQGQKQQGEENDYE